MQLTLSSPAKLNLFLHVTGQKPDGYHLIQTWFQYLDWCDYLTFSLLPNSQEIILKTTHPDLLEDLQNDPKDNLILKAADLLKKHVSGLNLPLSGVEIILNKNLPLGAGIGGGSSNAATTLVALNHLWQLKLSKQALMTIGETLGADIPFFIFGHSAFAEGIGEKLTQLSAPEYTYLVITPEVQVSTPIIYQDSGLTRSTSSLRIDTLKHADPLLLHTLGICNDLEPVVCKLSLPVYESLNWLSQFGPARVTGSGSSVFLGFKTRFEAEKVLNLLPNLLASTRVSGKIARAVNDSPLYDNWGVAKW
jgi:4-diphosphocytidyl-2-C-methyl-D-erythritol kinase